MITLAINIIFWRFVISVMFKLTKFVQYVFQYQTMSYCDKSNTIRSIPNNDRFWK
jgi:hypothetical protein